MDAAPTAADVVLQAAIVAIRQQHPAYGYRRVTQALRDTAVVVNRKRVQRVMRTLLAPPGPRRRPWVVAEPDAITGAWYPNLRATVAADGPNQVWVADPTYLRVAGSFAYLAIILDAWSRKVIGYAVGPVLDARLPLAALDAACETLRPPVGCVHHSDRGTRPDTLRGVTAKRLRPPGSEARCRGRAIRLTTPRPRAS